MDDVLGQAGEVVLPIALAIGILPLFTLSTMKLRNTPAIKQP